MVVFRWIILYITKENRAMDRNPKKYLFVHTCPNNFQNGVIF